MAPSVFLSGWPFLLFLFIFIFVLVILLIIIIVFVISLLLLIIIVYRDGNVGHIVPRLWACLAGRDGKVLSPARGETEVRELAEVLLLRPAGYD